MKDRKSFLNSAFLIVLVIFCSCIIGQKIFERTTPDSGQGGSVEQNDFGAYLAAQHALYVNDFDNAFNMIESIKTDNAAIKQAKNISSFFSGKMPEDAKNLKSSKDFVDTLIYDAFLIQQDDWKSVYERHKKDESLLSAPLRIFSALKQDRITETKKFVSSVKTNEYWKAFIMGQIAVLNNDVEGAAKEFAKVHPDFMNINDYLYLMSFYQHNGMSEDMEILRDDFIANPCGAHVLNYTEIPDWSNFEGYKNNLIFSIIQTVSHTQVMIYTDLSLLFLRFAQTIADDANMDVINYYLGQYYSYNSGDYKTCFNSIRKSSPFYLFGQLRIAEKENDAKTIREISKNNPLFVPAQQIAVRNSVVKGDKSGALSLINRALRQKNLPDNGRIYFLKQRAYIYLLFNDAKHAQKDLNAIEDLDPKLSSDILLLQARTWYLENKKLDKAYDYAMTLIKNDTSDVFAWDL
ncbi:MAG: hypothetical protein IJQ55_00810, partial [Alphaproteobacteria bacterium]|nr:hypothetical protein [Alphaproteobacteria bacterium]